MTRPFRPRSVRARLALWHGLALVVVVSIYAVAVWWQMRGDLYEELERSARMLAQSAAGEAAATRAVRGEREVQQELSEFALALVASLPFAFLVAAGAGYLLARRALAPVAEMTVLARQITAERLQDCLPVSNPDDELGQLATVFNDALARLEKSFTTLRQFTADASHEMRTPLTAIRAVGEVALREPHPERDYREVIGSMLEEADRMNSLVESLLTLARADADRGSLELEVLDLVVLAREVVDHLSVLAEDKKQVMVLDAGSAVAVRANRAALRQAVINIVDNAIKYTPDGGRIRIAVTAGAGEAVLHVQDFGPGIPPDHASRIFERFYRIDRGRSRQDGGAGLGLAIAKWAVEANHGRIEVDSPPSGGSVFRIVLPLSAEGAS